MPSPDSLSLMQSLKTACSNCGQRELCMPLGLSNEGMLQIDDVVAARRKLRRGDALFNNGAPFVALYAVRTGFFKTTITSVDGHDQVTGFQMAGEIVGFDGIVYSRHTCDAVALEDAEVCILPFERLGDIARQVPALQMHIHRMLSREIVHDHGIMLLLGNKDAQERLAAFLLDLLRRLRLRGFSQSEVVLRMTREEIGSYLGIKLETVSRMFSRFAALGYIEVRKRHIRICDVQALRKLVTQHGPQLQD